MTNRSRNPLRSPAMMVGLGIGAMILIQSARGVAPLLLMLALVLIFALIVGGLWLWAGDDPPLARHFEAIDSTPGRTLPESPAFWIGCGAAFIGGAALESHMGLAIALALVGMALASAGASSWVGLARRNA